MDDIFDWEESKWDAIKYFPIRTWQKIKDFYYQRKYSIQRLFFGFGDVDIFEFYSTMSHIILPRLIDFKKHHHGYPGIFSDYSENEWQNKEDYDKRIADGSILGGGDEAWVTILDKMIFAFTYIIAEDGSPTNRFEKKLVKEYHEKYGDVWEEKDSNIKKHSYHLFVNEDPDIKDDDIASAHIPEDNFDGNTIAEEEAKGMTYKGFKKRSFHHNDELAEELNKKCEEGLKLFGEYFRNLWD